MNGFLLFVEVIVVFSMLLALKRTLGKTGVFVWIALASVIANLETTKTVDIFGISVMMGNVMFASIFLATDILSECYGKKEAKKGVYIGVFSIVIYLVCTQLLLAYKPSGIDIAHNAMSDLFSLTPRVCIASLIMFFVANYVDVHIYSKMYKKFKGKKLWLRNNISTILCNCLENFGFVFLAFVGIYSVKDIIAIGVSTSIIEIGIALCDTPFLYAAKKMKGNE